MEVAGGSSGPKNVNRKVIRNAHILFDILHDNTILAKDKLSKMTEVLSGDHIDINYPDDHDRRNTLLHGAVLYGFVYVVKLLLEYNADVNSKNVEGETPLHLVLSDKRMEKNKLQKPIIQLLIGHKADVNIQNLSGDTLLHLAVRQEKIPVIRLLVEKANAGIPNTSGVTALYLAKEKNNKTINDIFDSNDRFDLNNTFDLNVSFDFNDTVDSSFNKSDTVPQDELYPHQDNKAGVADTSVAKDENQVEQLADAFADLKVTYAASGAKHSIHGTVYQLCLLMMFALRALSLGYAFRLGTEVDEAEQFDDIVFKYQLPKSGKIKNLFVQAKHKANASKGLHLSDLLAKGNKAQFSLLKYYKSFVKIKQAKGQEACEIDFAICTNTHFEFDELCKLVGDNTTLSLEIATDMYQELFKEGKCYTIIADDKTVRFLIDDFITKLKIEIEELRNKNTQELNVILSSLNDDTSLRTFLTYLIFVVEQPADNNLVKTEFRAHSKINLLDNDLLTDAFYKQIFNWFISEKGVWLQPETITNIIESITGSVNTFASSGISRVHAENLLNSPLKFQKDKLVELNELMSEYRIVNVTTSMESKLTLIQVAQAIEHSDSYKEFDSYMFMRVSSLLSYDNKYVTVDAFKASGKHNLLVIDCLSKMKNVTHDQLSTLKNKLLKITSNNSQKKLVFITPENHSFSEMFSSCSGYYEHAVKHTWNDLTSETQDILLVTHVYLQGQLVELNQVIHKTEKELLEIVPLETLIGDEGLVIGTELPTPIGYNEFFYIDRFVNYVNHIVLKDDIFEEKCTGNFKEELAKTETDFQNQCIKHPGANIHLIKKQGDRFIWVKSQGEFKALRPYIDCINYHSCSEGEFLNSVKLQRVVVISDLAGMGKSMVLTHFSSTIKAKYKGTLVFRIDLNLHTTLFENHTKMSTIFENSSALEFLCNEIIMTKTPLERELLKRKGKVVLMFDGFDEISPDYENTVLELIQNLTKDTEAQIWITTRPFMREKLEDKLRQWSCSLQPFSTQTQVDYLTKYWKHKKNIKDPNDGWIKDFASSLVARVSESITDKEREFTGIPLQIKMLAECFVDDCEKSPDFKHCFNLVDLYDTFIKKKFEIYHIEKTKTDGSKVGAQYIQKILFESCVKPHRHLALSVIFTEEKSHLLLIDYKNVIVSVEKINMINKIGIVNVTNRKYHFIHRTFAEYFVAEYFVDILKEPKRVHSRVKSFILYELLINNNYLVIRAFINGLLAKWQPAIDTLSEFKPPLLTRDDINNKYEEIKEFFFRTATEGNKHICIHLLNSVQKEDDMVQKLLQDSTADNNETLLHLAARNNNAKFIKTLLKWTRVNTDQGQKIPNLMLQAVDYSGANAFMRASIMGHIDVILTLQRWTRDNLVGGQDILTRMLEACNSDGWNSLQLASSYGHGEVVHTLLQWARGSLDEGQERVKRMLEGHVSNGPNSLHDAILGGHNDVVHKLLQWTLVNLDEGQGIVKRWLEAYGSRGMNSLHMASYGGHSVVVQTLLQWASDNCDEGQDIVKRMLTACTRTDQTLPNTASAAEHIVTVKTPRQFTRDNLVGFPDVAKRLLDDYSRDGQTSLHLASAHGYRDVVRTLLDWTRDNLDGSQDIVQQMLAARDSGGQISLHWALTQGHNNVVQTLLQWSLDNLDGGQGIVERMLEACNSSGYTSMHRASACSSGEFVKTLLDWTLGNLEQGQRIAKRMLEACNNTGQISLHVASAKGNSDVVQTLLQWTRDNLDDGQETVKRMLEACDGVDQTSLHMASAAGHNAVLNTLQVWTRDNTNRVTDVMKRILEDCHSSGQTSLHKASTLGHNDVVRTLLDWTRDNLDEGHEIVKRMVEACDSTGWTSLHVASCRGRNDVVRTLLQWTRDNLDGGQDIVRRMLKACNSSGQTSLHRASTMGHSDVVRTLLQWANDNLEEDQEVLKRMLEACDSWGQTSLHMASAQGHCDVVNTLLHWTRDNLVGGQDIVKRMLEACDSRGQTSLHMASSAGHNDMVQTLLQWSLDNMSSGHLTWRSRDGGADVGCM